jgi:hypothetical protein
VAAGDRRKRLELAKAMLYDRMCPQGGWNCGNPVVYGVAGQPQVGPTVWALIALCDEPAHPQNRKSLAWLEANYQSVRTPESLALTHMGMRVYGRHDETLTTRLNEFHQTAALPLSVPALAWTILGLSESGHWLDMLLPGKT